MEESLFWINNKQSTLQKKKTYTFKYNLNNPDMVLNIPLEYVSFSPTKILTPKKKFLVVSNTSLSFECFNNAGVKTHSTAYQIDFKQITKFCYAMENCLFNIAIREEFYDQIIPSCGRDDKLFRHRIWFCLDVDSAAEYRRYLEKLSTNENFAEKQLIISAVNYECFVGYLVKNNVSARFVSKWKPTTATAAVNNATDDAPVRVGAPRRPKTRKSEFPTESGSAITPATSPPPRKRANASKLSLQKSVYVPSTSHSIEICAADLLCLRPRSYVNDNVINLYVTYIYYEIMTPAQRQRTHFFNCFFNTKLIGSRAEAATDTPETRHARVAKWTKNVDIFEKDFLIVPVIETQHWFLVIVCFPWMAGMVDYGRVFHPDGEAAAPPSASIPANESRFATHDRVERLRALKAAEGPDYLPLPCILVFDSLTLQKRTDKVNIIRDYLKSEWDAKRAQRDGPLVFDKNTARGYSPKVPQQNNHTDCGVYLLHYVESFFKCPIKKFSYDFFKSFLTKWFEQSQVERKREEIRDTIIKIIHKSDDVDMINK